MNRNIKFRVWDKEDKRMIVHEQEFIPLKVTNIGVFKLDPCSKEDRWILQDKDRFELMQYTGIHDESEDETEIYEGDIVEFNYKEVKYTGIVKFEAGAFILACEQIGDSYITLLDIIQSDRDYWWIDGVVIGNVYENPDLLNA